MGAYDGESHDSSDYEDAHNRHGPVEIAPPPGTFVLRLVHEPELVSDIDWAKSALALPNFFHLEFWVRGEW